MRLVSTASRPQFSRRDFLVTASATLAATALPRLAFADQVPAYKLGIQLYSLRGYDVNEALQHAADLGFEQVEFYSGMLPTNSSANEVSAIKKKVADLGMTISAHGVNKLTKNADKNRKLFEFAKLLGIPTITADPDPDSFDNLDGLVKEFDIRVAIHNHGPRHRYNKAVDVLDAIKGHDDRIGACADLGHYIRSGQSATEVIRLLQGRLYGIHLKDFAEMKDKTEGVILGKGHLDVEGVFMALQAVGFPANGAISLEYEENPKNPLEEIRECVTVAQAAMKRPEFADTAFSVLIRLDDNELPYLMKVSRRTKWMLSGAAITLAVLLGPYVVSRILAPSRQIQTFVLPVTISGNTANLNLPVKP